MLGKIGRFLKGVVTPASVKTTRPPPAATEAPAAKAPPRTGLAQAQQDVVVRSPSPRVDPRPVRQEMEGPPEPVVPGSAPRGEGLRVPGEIAQVPAPPVPDIPPDPEPPADVRTPRGDVDLGRLGRGRAGFDEGNDPPEEVMPTGAGEQRRAEGPRTTPRPGGIRPPRSQEAQATPPAPPVPPEPDDGEIRSRTAQARTPSAGPDGPGRPTGPTGPDPRAQAQAAMPPAGEPEDDAPQIRQSTKGPVPRPEPPRPEQ